MNGSAQNHHSISSMTPAAREPHGAYGDGQLAQRVKIAERAGPRKRNGGSAGEGGWRLQDPAR